LPAHSKFSLFSSSDFIFFCFYFFLFHTSSVIKRLFDRNQQETIKKTVFALNLSGKIDALNQDKSQEQMNT